MAHSAVDGWMDEEGRCRADSQRMRDKARKPARGDTAWGAWVGRQANEALFLGGGLCARKIRFLFSSHARYEHVCHLESVRFNAHIEMI